MAFKGLKKFFGLRSEMEKKERAFDACETLNSFKYLQTTDLQYLGIPENITKSLTFDSVQGLLAVGNMEGQVKM